MRNPINLSHIFRFSPTWNVEWNSEKECVTIDDFYEDPDAINDWLRSQDYPRWKYFTPDTTRNGVDYDDCRIIIPWPVDLKRKSESYFQPIFDIVGRHFWRGMYTYDMKLEFNCFRSLKEYDNEWQHCPHIDTFRERFVLNMIVFLDKNGNGGTAIYDGQLSENIEHENLFYRYKDKNSINHKLDHKYNRCVIFSGDKTHGAYIDNYKHYMDNWRYTQVYFLTPKE